MPKCDACGRFHREEPGSAWKQVYFGIPLSPDHILTRCKNCVKEYGQFLAQDNIRPEFSCGLIAQDGLDKSKEGKGDKL